MLKNDDSILPLPKSGKKIAVVGFIGSNAVVHGGGSGSVVPSFIASPLAGITSVAGAEALIPNRNLISAVS